MEAIGTTPNLLGTGIYTVSDVARYIHVSPQQVRNWSMGRTSRASGARGGQAARTIPGVLVTPPARVDGETVLSFAQLIELRLVRLFRQRGVSMPVIKASAQSLSRLLQTRHPFSSMRLKTDGRRIFADMTVGELARGVADSGGEPVSDEKVLQDLQNLQSVMGDIVRVYLQSVEYEDDMASRWWLLGGSRRAVLDPYRAFGQPIDDPTGVPLSALYNMVKAGDDAQTVAGWYGVPLEAVDTAIALYTSFDTKPGALS